VISRFDEVKVGVFNTDAAEAILIGYWASRRWIERNRISIEEKEENEPLVERYTNGAVVVPKDSR